MIFDNRNHKVTGYMYQCYDVELWKAEADIKIWCSYMGKELGLMHVSTETVIKKKLITMY